MIVLNNHLTLGTIRANCSQLAWNDELVGYGWVPLRISPFVTMKEIDVLNIGRNVDIAVGIVFWNTKRNEISNFIVFSIFRKIGA